MNGRLKRAGQLGLLAKDLVALRCRRRSSTRAAALRQVVERLGLLHGLPQKIGQLLSFSSIEGSDSAFAPLTEGQPTLSGDEVREVLALELGEKSTTCFAAFSDRGISASIGQVHQARLRDGREVAVKVQYPEISEHIECDLKALGWLTAPVGDLRKDFDITAYRREIGEMLAGELDYGQEAEWLRRFQGWTRCWPDVIVPEVIPELSNRKILTMTWLDGKRIGEIAEWGEAERKVAAECLLRLFLTGLFQWGALHADPHAGNYRFIRDAAGVRVGVLDFGCVKVIPPALAEGIVTLIHMELAGQGDEETVWSIFLNMGFDAQRLKPMKAALPQISKILCEPFTSGNACDVLSWDLGGRLAAILGPHRMAFRLAGPPEIIFVLRAMQGLIHYLRLLRVPLHWGTLFQKFSPAPKKAVNSAVQPADTSSVLSESLHIRITEGLELKMAMSFGAKAVDHLVDLVPVELRPKLESRAVDLPSVVAKVRAENYAPGELFALNEQGRTIRVWLE